MFAFLNKISTFNATPPPHHTHNNLSLIHDPFTSRWLFVLRLQKSMNFNTHFSRLVLLIQILHEMFIKFSLSRFLLHCRVTARRVGGSEWMRKLMEFPLLFFLFGHTRKFLWPRKLTPTTLLGWGWWRELKKRSSISHRFFFCAGRKNLAQIRNSPHCSLSLFLCYRSSLSFLCVREI